jgi:hypothetical protein
MAWTSVSIESILATIAAVLFAVAGVVNLAGPGAVKRDFARWGYPAWFRLLSNYSVRHFFLDNKPESWA